MTKIEVECFSTEVNAVVVRTVGRRFPGVIIQGDSLHIIMQQVDEIARLSDASQNFELQDAISKLRENLDRYVAVYEDALREHDIPLPY
jgi:predicted RNase H-like HicB family nuclease